MEPPCGESRRTATFVVGALTATAALHIPLIVWLDFSFALSSPSLYLYLAGVAMPSVIAMLLLDKGDRLDFLRSALSPKAPVRTYAWALLVQVGIVATAWLLANLLGLQLAPSLKFAPGLALLAVGQIWIVLGEELGWRGFALPRLVALFGFRRATLVLAVVWAAWHAPMFFVAGSLQQGVAPWLFAASIYAWSAVHSGLYLRASPSIIPNLVFHASANITLNFGVVTTEVEPYLFGVYILFGTALLVWLPGKRGA